MIEIVKYSSELKRKWDDFIHISRNGTFLFLRDYMDYHADRFADCSYLFLRKGNIEAVLPGNRVDNSFFSHQGLTHGGLITSNKTSVSGVIEMFYLLNRALTEDGVQEVIYKPVPLIYHSIPSQEDIYALFLHKAEKIGCQISSVIFQSNKPRFSELRRRGVQKSIKENVEIIVSNDLAAFWEILENNLINKFKLKPTHSLEEIKLLYSRFPDNIKLYVAVHEGIIIAGTVVYLKKNVVKVQYIAASETGKQIGALDLLFDKLIHEEFQQFQFFDFGVSTESMGNYLNQNLIFQKEGFGGRGVVYETYKYNLQAGLYFEK